MGAETHGVLCGVAVWTGALAPAPGFLARDFTATARKSTATARDFTAKTREFAATTRESGCLARKSTAIARKGVNGVINTAVTGNKTAGQF
jgi:hypothetical protein